MTEDETCGTGDGTGSLVTTITSLVSRRGHEKLVAREFERIFASDPASTHHLKALLIQQEDGVSFLISCFADRAGLRAWRQSDDHRSMERSFDAHSMRALRTVEQPVARILVPSDTSGPKWKGFLAGWLVSLPILILVVALLERLTPRLATLPSLAIISLVMSLTTTWLVAPILGPLTRTWRLQNQQIRIVVHGQAAAPARAGPGASPRSEVEAPAAT